MAAKTLAQLAVQSSGYPAAAIALAAAGLEISSRAYLAALANEAQWLAGKQCEELEDACVFWPLLSRIIGISNHNTSCEREMTAAALAFGSYQLLSSAAVSAAAS